MHSAYQITSISYFFLLIENCWQIYCLFKAHACILRQCVIRRLEMHIYKYFKHDFPQWGLNSLN